jgi:uncharacterized protein
MDKLHPRRLVLLTLGMAFMSLGIALSVRSDLGTTTISSLPYVLSLISPLTLGTAAIVVNLGLVSLQVLLLGRRFQLIQLLQLPILVVFGLFTDLAMWVTGGIGHSAYWQQWLLTLTGIIFLGIGINFQIAANTVMLAGEAVVMTLSRELCRKFGSRRVFVFGNVKIALDIVMVLSAVILSLAFLQEVAGVREGTVAAAILIGFAVKTFQPVIGPPLARFRSGA